MAGGAASARGAPASTPAGVDAAPLHAGGPGSGGVRPFVVAVIGGMVTGTTVAAALLLTAIATPSEATLDSVAPATLSDAGGSLDQTAGRQALEDARQCKAPLAFVTVSAAPGAQPSRIRIRSGGYLSPTILITDAPRRIAIPFPAPYPAGRGVIAVEGAAFGLNVWLAPGHRFSALNGTEVIPVTWTPRNPC